MELQYLLFKSDGIYLLIFFNKQTWHHMQYSNKIKTKYFLELVTDKQMMEEVRFKAKEAAHRKREVKMSEDDTEEVNVKELRRFYINRFFHLRI